MKFLLDTHAFLWWILEEPQLSPTAGEIISNGQNELYVSAASGLEMAIKAKLGKLELPDNIESFILEQTAINNFKVLPIKMSHALHVYTLPFHHQDPFDRVLVAQARLDKMTIITVDKQIALYPVEVTW
jgi:PIN domain nuclease of toxin-antitoxin system